MSGVEQRQGEQAAVVLRGHNYDKLSCERGRCVCDEFGGGSACL